MSTFRAGADLRRNRRGRPPSAAGVMAKILKLIGPNITDICDQAVMMARAGDPAAISACASLLAAALAYKAVKD